MNAEQAKAACEALSEWLCEYEGYKKPPSEITAALDFEADGLNFYVIKYKKSALSKSLIGVVCFEGNSLEKCRGIYTDAKEPYNEKTALDYGREYAQYVHDDMARRKQQDEVKALFRKNLDYTLSKTLDADVIARQFVKTETRFFLEVGKVDIKSGRVVAADPLCYLAMGKFRPTLETEIPNGTYPAEVSIFRNDLIGLRMCTARLKIKDTKAVRYELAKPVPDTAANVSEDGEVWTGYPVDAGMMCFIDSKGADEFGEWVDNWHKENKGKNHYDDYFAALFAESYKKLPAYQREDGDFIEWTNPDTNERMVMVSSGFGDGFYQCFWGYDESGEVCELVSPLVNPDLFD